MMKNYFFCLLILVFFLSCSGEISKEELQAQKAIRKAYQEWVYKKVKNGEYWYESKWQAEFDKRSHDLFLGNCKEGLPDDFYRVYYGDINLDSQIDGIAHIVILGCSGGTGDRFNSKDVFFISNKSNYTVIEEPTSITSKIGIAGTVDTILNNGIIVYTARDYSDNDALCCPSREWKVKFKYEKGGFKKIK